MTETLLYPSLPPLKWYGYDWACPVKLPSWAGFGVIHGLGDGADDPTEVDGTVWLTFGTTEYRVPNPPLPEQIAAIRHLLDNEAEIGEKVGLALLKYCPGNCYDGDDETLLNVSQISDLRSLVRLSLVHVMEIFHDGIAGVGFEFDCVWDREHGAGVTTHKGETLWSGQGEIAFRHSAYENHFTRLKNRASQ